MDLADIIHYFDCPDFVPLNKVLANSILALPDDVFLARSHFFHGRFENLYLDAHQIPGLKMILVTAQQKAAELLQQSPDELKIGFWLNIMQQGDVTTRHSHDDHDELLSAVYYIQSPPGSGEFLLHQGDILTRIKPVVGRFMFFEEKFFEFQNSIGIFP